MGKTYTSLRGKPVDMERLVLKNEKQIAVGNIRVNARGDEIGPGGKIIRTREQVLQDYHNNNQSTSKE